MSKRRRKALLKESLRKWIDWLGPRPLRLVYGQAEKGQPLAGLLYKLLKEQQSLDSALSELKELELEQALNEMENLIDLLELGLEEP